MPQHVCEQDVAFTIAFLIHVFFVVGVIWTMKFSKNGKYLASAGQDAAIRVWEVYLKRGETADSEGPESNGAAGERRCMSFPQEGR